MAVTIHVQSVLYNTPLGEIWRFMRGLESALRGARDAGAVSSVTIRLGDCSPRPAIGDGDLEQLRGLVEPLGDVRLDYVYFNENRMTARGHNSLAEGATADFLLVINPDTYASPCTLTELVAAMARPEVAVSEARQIPIEHPKKYDRRTGETSWASTCCVLIRRSVFEFLEGFDARFFPLYCDDVDFSWRARLNYNTVVFVPAAPIFHDKQLSAGGTVCASSVEEYYSVFARLMLTRRYGSPDIEGETRTHVEKSGSVNHRRALADFDARVASGDVPEQLSRAADVAEFIRGEYADHRY